MLLTIKSLLNILPIESRRQARNLLALIIFMAFSDAIGVATIFPFMQLVSENDSLSEFGILKKSLDLIGITEKSTIISLFGVVMVLILICNAYLKTLTLKRQIEFTQKTEANISQKYLLASLSKPYKWHLNNNSSEIGKNILSEVNLVVNSGILQLFILASQGLILLSILALLCILNPLVTGVVILFCMSTYLLLYLSLKHKVQYLGEMRSAANAKRFLAVNEALNSFREVKVNSLEHQFSEKFYTFAIRFAEYQAKSNLIYHLPKYILEGLVFSIIICVLVIFTQNDNSINLLMPTLALFTFSGYKILPAVNQIYLASSQLKYVANAARSIEGKISIEEVNEKEFSTESYFNNLILKDISFSYDATSRTVLNDISLEIERGDKVAIIGESGSGKTTLVDILFGLLDPTNGVMILNSTPERSLKHLKKVSYVSQQMYFVDDTILNNLNINQKEITEGNISTAIATVGLDSYIRKLDKNYAFEIGENGEKLSGGQRQRLGIARSLVQEPEVLVLDEATSALDEETEKHFMDNLKINYPDMTLIMITHRPNILRGFDKIVVLSGGYMVEQTSFEKLVERRQNQILSTPTTSSTEETNN